jgi:hypothetical protein
VSVPDVAWESTTRASSSMLVILSLISMATPCASLLHVRRKILSNTWKYDQVSVDRWRRGYARNELGDDECPGSVFVTPTRLTSRSRISIDVIVVRGNFTRCVCEEPFRPHSHLPKTFVIAPDPLRLRTPNSLLSILSIQAS